MNTLIPELLDLSNRAKKDAIKYPRKREFLNVLNPDSGRHFIGIAGPRGAGKTVLLKQLAANKSDYLYLSADTLMGRDLYSVARILVEDYKIRHLLVDEIHFCSTYAKDLKKIYDFLDIRIIFTSSISLSLFESAYDLSRRAILHTLYPFSFREYLLFSQNAVIPQLTLDDIIEENWAAVHLTYSHFFDRYLQGALLPFALDEPNHFALLKNILTTIIHKDIPTVANIRFEEIEKIEKVVAFIAKSEVDGINFSSISRNIGITKYKAEQYVNLLENAFVLN